MGTCETTLKTAIAVLRRASQQIADQVPKQDVSYAIELLEEELVRQTTPPAPQKSEEA